MFSVESCEIPVVALLGKYLKDGTYADCHMTDIPNKVTQAEYVSTLHTNSAADTIVRLKEMNVEP